MGARNGGGAVVGAAPPPMRLRHAADARDGAVCSENYAAWLSLLPCSDAEGVAQVLGGSSSLGAEEVIRAARYASLRLRLLTECVGGRPSARRGCDCNSR